MASSEPNHALLSFPSMLAPNENMQNGGGLELVLMENASSFLSTLASNPTFLSAIFALFLTQSTKVCFNYFKERQWNLRHFLASQGTPSPHALFASQVTPSPRPAFAMPSTPYAFASQGMPSTRSALCSALTTSVALTHGVAASLFPLSFGFSLILMSNAAAVRKHVAYQAFVINAILNELFKGTPKPDEKIDENVGDTLPQLLSGALLGSTAAILCSLGFMLLR